MTGIVAKANNNRDMSEAGLLFHFLITCGRKVMEEILPATIPGICIGFMIIRNE